MKGRVRQFNAARDRNLTETYTNVSQNSVAGNITSNRPSFNEPSTSSFIKKTKSELCFNCVNKKLVKNKEEKKMNEAQMNLMEKRKLEESLREYRDPAQQFKKKVAAENSDYNKKVLKRKLQSAKSEKLMDTKIVEELCQKQKQVLEEQARKKEEEKLADFKYRQELIIQKHLQEAKKEQERKERLQAEINVLPLKNNDKTEMIKSYAMDLKAQMAQQASKKESEKEKKIRLDKEMIQKSDQDFQKKFTQFANKSNRAPHQSNPEVFEQIKSMEQAKKINKMRQRQTNAKEREETAKKLKQLEDKSIQSNMKAMEEYAIELQRQIINKKQMEHSRKMDDLNYKWKDEKYTEDLAQQNQKIKVCGQCKEKYDQKCLTPFN